MKKGKIKSVEDIAINDKFKFFLTKGLVFIKKQTFYDKMTVFVYKLICILVNKKSKTLYINDKSLDFSKRERMYF
jgi:hypothetical protein